MTEDMNALIRNMDACLIAIEDGKPVPTNALNNLPPWRAVLCARAAERAGIPLEQGNVPQLRAAASRAGGDAPAGWWLSALANLPFEVASSAPRPTPARTGLPTKDEMFGNAVERLDMAYHALGDAADWLRSDWRPVGSELSDEQAEARIRMQRKINDAKAAINRAKG